MLSKAECDEATRPAEKPGTAVALDEQDHITLPNGNENKWQSIGHLRQLSEGSALRSRYDKRQLSGTGISQLFPAVPRTHRNHQIHLVCRGEGFFLLKS